MSGSGGIRTHAPEETGALNQRLRPLGHATYYWQQCVHGKLFLALPHLQEQFSWTAYYLNVNTWQNKKVAVRSGIWTHALIRGPEFSIQLPIMRVRYSPWVWRLRPLGHPDRVKLMWKILTSKTNGYIFWAEIKWIFNFWKKHLAERSFDLRTSGLWAQHASTAPLCYHAEDTSMDTANQQNYWFYPKIFCVRSGIRTHAHRSGLRPERSALDHSAILTLWC